MTEELNKLFEAKQRAHHQYQMLQSVNIYNKSIEERIAIDLSVETARQNWLKATMQYSSALEKYVKENNK
jgi:hypothetical protein